MIETLDDIIEQLADKCGIYGACVDENEEEECDGNCRPQWTSRLRNRIEAAISVEIKLGLVQFPVTGEKEPENG